MSQIKNLFPHLVIGPPKKISQEFATNLLITYDVSPSSVFDELTNLATEEAALVAYKNKAESFLGIQVLGTKTELVSIFPEFDLLVETLNVYTGEPTDFTVSLDSGITEKFSDLWDALFVQYILNDNPSLLNDLALAIKLITLSNSGLTGVPIVQWWKNSQIVFPNPPFPLPKAVVESTLGQIPTAEPNSEVILSELEALQETYAELVNAFDDQIQSSKLKKIDQASFSFNLKQNLEESIESNTSNSPEFDAVVLYREYLESKDGEILLTDNVSNLSPTSRNVLGGLNIAEDSLNVPFALRRIERRTSQLLRSLPTRRAESYVAVIGGSLLTIDDAVYGDIICSEDASLTHCALLHQLSANISDREYVQVLGMGHANVIRQKIIRHEADEIAHIENILQGEKKEKTHRNLKTQEDFTYSEKEKNEESETDTKSTNRFELSKEVSKITQESSEFEAGVAISAGMGPVSIQANVNYATGSSSSEIGASSVKLSKEITERAINRIQERSLEIRSSRSTNEVEVTNLHSINNEGGTDHINGFYYWVDKVYENQVYNIGKRLMLEFMIPEPAAHHIFSAVKSKNNNVTVSKPIHPSDYVGNNLIGSLKSFKDISRANYHIWSAVYDAQNVSPPPTEIFTVANAYSLDVIPEGKQWYDYSFKDLKVPEGYEAEFGRMTVLFSGGNGRYISGHLGSSLFSYNSGTASADILPLNQETDIVPLSFRGHFG